MIPPRCARTSAALLLTLLTACSDARDRAETVLARGNTAQVRRDAALLYKDLFAASGPGVTTLSAKDWPASFQPFKPLRVGAYRDGIALVLESKADAEAGLYIVPEGMNHAPASTHRAKFHPLREGIFWYAFGE